MILLNAIPAIAVSLFTPWAGAWIADVDLDLSVVPVMPSGRAVLTIDTLTFAGTIDDRASGPFGNRGRARLVAGAGGWEKTVGELHFANDAGLLSSVVRAQTAAEVLEVLTDVSPSVVGLAYSRAEGPARQVLPPGGWYVTPAGITIVGPRVPLPASPDITIVSWDPLSRVAELATELVVTPGTILVDPKFGTATVRDVEQTWDGDSIRVKAFCNLQEETELGAELARFVREVAGVAHARGYLYRVVFSNVDNRLVLQIVDPSSGMPNMLPISMWPGVPGVTAKPAPGSKCIVEFQNGDPTKPAVVAFEGTTPATALAFAAATIALVGGVTIGPVVGVPKGIALFDPFKAFADAVATAIASLNAGSGVTVPQQAAVDAAHSALATAVSAQLLVTG